MDLKIDIVGKNVVISLGEQGLFHFKNIEAVEVKKFSKLEKEEAYFDAQTYFFGGLFSAGSGGTNKQMYGYVERGEELIKIAGGGGSATGSGTITAIVDKKKKKKK